jgi:hypothetical protein
MTTSIALNELPRYIVHKDKVCRDMTNASCALILLIVMIFAPNCSAAHTNTCDLAQDDRAGQSLDKAKDLTAVFAISKAFPDCLGGGGLSEGISDKIVTLLDRHWDRSMSILYRHRDDAPFVSFVLQHIDETTSDIDLRQIVKRSTHSCPARYKAICAKIESTAKVALRDH